MIRKRGVLFLSIVMLAAVALSFAIAGAENSVTVSTQNSGIVEKSRGEAFTVSITFQNTGTSDGSWTVNVVFEGDSWNWKGTAKSLTLNANERKTLVWNGAVPTNATINSVARLVVYYGDSVKALDWWIQVASNAELSIQSSNVS
jgi:hypothetical protein